jgi:hypothetical protein
MPLIATITDCNSATLTAREKENDMTRARMDDVRQLLRVAWDTCVFFRITTIAYLQTVGSAAVKAEAWHCGWHLKTPHNRWDR